MSFRTFGLGLSAAAAFSAVAVLEAPVQAASITNQTLSFTGSARLETPDAVTSLLNFSSYDNTTAGTVTLADASADVFGAAGSSFSLGDLSLTKTNATTWELTPGSTNSWLTGLADGIGFTLEQFILEQVSVTAGPATIPLYVAFVSGFFTPSGLAGSGALTAQGSLVFNSGSSFSADITAVPTPALLPGLVGLGAMALRKRSQDSFEEEA
ncbi:MULTISPECIES: PTPA-CTERM sorting domain-containing protein [Cyanophyceae]|uniref:PTPA-CTERM sorting domain-containing protein n=1 Tax=Leptolyngbya subtilissima DQ-A4 TaxID=2933933 RepID=A0ABV0JZ22_9CYAN|nr:PTPA-CTERM sorting domain-containing protein [Nodosilinea sp. FACHB-141]MBD2112375.1 PTPA-CTERM sorting domain-containing protein [Nodosilinea sp. FACHB-141]